MARRRKSGQGLYMSQAAKKILKDKKRRRRRGIPEKDSEADIGTLRLWIMIAALIILGGLVAWIAVNGLP